MEEKSIEYARIKRQLESDSRKLQDEVLGKELEEGAREVLENLADSVERDDSRLGGFDEEGNLVFTVPSKEGDIEKRVIRLGGKQRDYMVGLLKEREIELE